MSESKKAPRLGRGLDALMKGGGTKRMKPAPKPQREIATAGEKKAIAETRPDKNTVRDTETPASPSGAEVDITSITPNAYQPRKRFDEAALSALAESIRTHGLMQPLVVRPSGRGYELIAGERRWRASQKAGLKTVSVIIRHADEEQAAELALVENLQREDLNPIEKAQALKALISEFGLTQAEVGRKVGLERPTIANLLRLLDLCDECQEMVLRGALKMGHARALAAVTDPSLQRTLALRAVNEDWSVRKVESEVRSAQQGGGAPATGNTPSSGTANAHLELLERELAAQLGAKVKIKGRKKGAGMLMIEYNSLDHFESLMERLNIEASF